MADDFTGQAEVEIPVAEARLDFGDDPAAGVMRVLKGVAVDSSLVSLRPSTPGATLGRPTCARGRKSLVGVCAIASEGWRCDYSTSCAACKMNICQKPIRAPSSIRRAVNARLAVPNSGDVTTPLKST